MGKSKLFWRTDNQIQAQELRVIGGDGKLLGVMSKSAAIEEAKKQGLTLIEIAPGAVPPVAKIADFGKFRYSEEKKLKKSQVKSKGGEVKEIRFSPFIGDADYSTRMKRVHEFLEDKNKVKIVVVFLGKQMNSKSFGYKLIEKIMLELGDTIAVDMPPKFLGRHLITIISPVNKRAKELKEQNLEKQENGENKDQENIN